MVNGESFGDLKLARMFGLVVSIRGELGDDKLFVITLPSLGEGGAIGSTEAES